MKVPYCIFCILLSMSMICRGQTVDSLTYRIHFEHNSPALEVERPDNFHALTCFAYDLDSLRNAAGVSVLDVIVRGSASWEGRYVSNLYLGRQRARVVTDYIAKSFNVEATPTESYQFESELIDLVSKSGSKYALNVLSILKSSETNDEKIQALKSLDSGRCWEWLSSSVFPTQRRADIVIRYSAPETVAAAPIVCTPPIQVEEPVKTEEPGQTVAAEPVDSVESRSSFYLALKNNLIYDAALVANLGLEISLGKHFALDLPFTFSPYNICDEYRMRTLSVQPELRYYFKPFGKGHYLGIHGNLAYYNVVTPLNTKTRFQDRDGEHPLYGGGIAYGYSLPFGKDSRWGIEFTIGAGYAYLDYDCFYNVNNGAWFSKDTKHYFGIDKAGITIFYRIVDNNKKKK